VSLHGELVHLRPVTTNDAGRLTEILRLAVPTREYQPGGPPIHATPTWSWPTRPGYLPRPPRSRRTIRTLGAAHRRLPHLTAVADMPEARIVVYTPMDDETRERLPLTRRLTAG
jgi:hypothetical protein